MSARALSANAVLSWRVRAGPAEGLAPGPKGQDLAVIADGWVTLYDRPGHRVWSVRADPDAVRGDPATCLWPSTGTQLFVLTGGRLHVYDADTGRPVPLPEGLVGVGPLSAMALSADDRMLAVGMRNGGLLVVDWHTYTHLPLGGADEATALAWDPRGQRLCSATSRSLQLWDVGNRTMTSSMRVDRTRALAWSPDGVRLAVAEQYGIRMVTPDTGLETASAQLPGAAAVAFSRDGSRILALGDLPDIRVYGTDLRTVQTLSPVDEVTGRVTGFGVGGDGTVAITAGVDVTLWALPDTRVPATTGAGAGRWGDRMAATLGRARPSAIPPGGASPRVLSRAAMMGIAWAPDENLLYFQPEPTSIAVSGGDEQADQRWSAALPPVRGGRYDLAVSLDGRYLAASAGAGGREPGEEVEILDRDSGRILGTVGGGLSPAFAPDDRFRLAVPEAGHRPRQVIVYASPAGDVERRLSVPEGVRRLAWSPDCQRMAVATGGPVVIFDTTTWQRSPGPPPSRAGYWRVAWSPDGALLAAAPGSDGGSVMIWDSGTWEVHHRTARAGSLLTGGRGWGSALTWSPRGRLLAFPGSRASSAWTDVIIWDVERGRVVSRLPNPFPQAAAIYTLAWSPGGEHLAVTYENGGLVRWDLLPGASGEPGRSAAAPGLPYPPALLARLGTSAAAEGFGVPLSQLCALVTLTGDEAPPEELASLTGTQGAAALSSLRWPPPARIGLVLLLLDALPATARYLAPDNSTRGELHAALRRALDGPATAVHPLNAPLDALAGALAAIDERLLTLLAVLGQEAVAADPTLPRRLRGMRVGLEPLTQRDRKLLALRLPVTDTGTAEGRGVGSGTAGLARHGELNRLLPTQLALPDEMLAARLARDELLFRTRKGMLPPLPQAAIIILDNTPATHGPMGVTLRLAAHLLAVTLLRLRRPCVLITYGATTATWLREPRDLVSIWTSGTLRPPDADQVRAVLADLSAHLFHPVAGAPRTIMLTHPYAEFSLAPELRTLWVHYPGLPVTPRDSTTYVLPPEPTVDELRDVLGRLLKGGE